MFIIGWVLARTKNNIFESEITRPNCVDHSRDFIRSAQPPALIANFLQEFLLPPRKELRQQAVEDKVDIPNARTVGVDKRQKWKPRGIPVDPSPQMSCFIK